MERAGYMGELRDEPTVEVHEAHTGLHLCDVLQCRPVPDPSDLFFIFYFVLSHCIDHQGVPLSWTSHTSKEKKIKGRKSPGPLPCHYNSGHTCCTTDDLSSPVAHLPRRHLQMLPAREESRPSYPHFMLTCAKEKGEMSVEISARPPWGAVWHKRGEMEAMRFL